MYQCILHRANCAGASLIGANLTYADFSEADLRGADLSGATMFRANLHRIQDEDALIPNRRVALGTDPELAAAQAWKPPF